MLRRLRAIIQRAKLDRDMRDEMDAHLARAAERLVARGMSPEAARLEARREFGNVGVLQEEARDVRGTQWIESVAGDVRFAFRHFSHRPLSALTIVAVLALGIGGHSAVFSVMQAVLTRPAPGVPDDDALVLVRPKHRPREGTSWFARGMSYPEWRDVAAMRDVFSSVAGWTTVDASVDVKPDEGALARVHFVTDGYFATLGVPLTLGAGLPPGAGAEAEPPAIIGYTMWQDAFAGARDVLGKTIRVNGVTARIVGVAPERFLSVTRMSATRVVWLPLAARATILRTTPSALVSRDTALLFGFARLQPSVGLEQASAAMQVASQRALAQMTPDSTPSAYTGDAVRLRGGIKVGESERSRMMNAIELGAAFGTIALLVLIVACTNVSAIAVGAAVARRHEIAVRMSLGASRARVVRQLLTESAMLAVAGGSLGLLLYWWFTTLIASQVTDIDLAPDFGTAAFTMLFALGTGILFGLSPALHATRQSVGEVLKDSASVTKRSRLQRIFVVAQIAFTQPLLVGLAMMLGVVTMETQGEWRDGIDNRIAIMKLYPNTRNLDEARAALERVDARLAELPGVVQIVRGTEGFRNTVVSVNPDDRGRSARAAEPISVHLEGGSPRYFELLGVRMVRGRELTRADTAAGVGKNFQYGSMRTFGPVIADQNVVIGSDVARELWDGGDPLGKRFIETLRDGQTRTFTVVGVFDASYATPRGAGTRFYVMSNHEVANTYLIRTAGPASALFGAIRSTVRSELPTSPIERLESLRQREEANALETNQITASAAGGGLLALLLASIGLYGVVSLAVTQRRREIGVRMALGARATQVVAMLFSGGVRLSVLGLVLGLPLSVVALRMLADQAHFPKTSAMFVGGGIALAVISVASVATWIPARRAAMIDPVSALRSE